MWYFLAGVAGLVVGFVIGIITVAYVEHNGYNDDEWNDEDYN